MHCQIKKWGNSLGVRVPMKLAYKLNLKDGSNVKIKINDNQLIITADVLEFDLLVSKINQHNRHEEIFKDGSVGKEIW